MAIGAEETSDTGSKGDPHLFLRGFIFAVGSSLIAWCAELLFLYAWASTISAQPDFGTNGLLWVTTTILTLDLLVLPISFGLWMTLVIPLLAHHRNRSLARWPNKVILHFVITAALIILRTAMYGASPIGLWIAFTFPVVVSAVVGGELLLRREIAALRKSAS